MSMQGMGPNHPGTTGPRLMGLGLLGLTAMVQILAIAETGRPQIDVYTFICCSIALLLISADASY